MGRLVNGKMVPFGTLNIGDVFSFDAGNGFGCIGIRRDRTTDNLNSNAEYTDGEGNTISGHFPPDQPVEMLVPHRESEEPFIKLPVCEGLLMVTLQRTVQLDFDVDEDDEQWEKMRDEMVAELAEAAGDWTIGDVEDDFDA
jgi:hypothetical protein